MRSLSALVLAVAAAALLAAPAAEAGDRQLYTLWVNMTPDAASSAASKACVADLEKKVKDDYTQITKLGETALRKQVGKTAGEPFLAWPAAAFDPVKSPKDRDGFDVAILVDCRPETQQLDILIVPASPGTATIQLRHVAIDRKLTDWASTAMLRRAWSGFSP